MGIQSKMDPGDAMMLDLRLLCRLQNPFGPLM